jgi:serine/threonine protein kinase
VYRVQRRGSSELFAVKKARQRFRGARDRARALEEVSAVQALGLVHAQHPQLVQHFDAWEENSFLYLQTELCAHGSLAEFLETHDPVDELRIWDWLLDMLLALDHVHRAGLVHMDVKPANIFLTSHSTLKLGDFGIAVRVDTPLADVAGGDSVYMPPELLETPPDAVATPAIDMFCLGASFFEVAAYVDLPRSGPLWVALRRGGVRWPDFCPHSHELKHLIELLLSPAIADRPQAAALLQLPLFAERLAHPRHIVPPADAPTSSPPSSTMNSQALTPRESGRMDGSRLSFGDPLMHSVDFDQGSDDGSERQVARDLFGGTTGMARDDVQFDEDDDDEHDLQPTNLSFAFDQ